MREMIKLLLVPVALFAFAGTGFAQGTTPAPAKPAAPTKPAAPAKTTEKKETTVKVSRARGELLAVDPKAGTATVKAKAGEMSVIADTKETKEALAKVKVGDPVRLMYTEKDGKLVLRKLDKGRVRTESRRSRQKTQKPESTAPAK